MGYAEDTLVPHTTWSSSNAPSSPISSRPSSSARTQRKTKISASAWRDDCHNKITPYQATGIPLVRTPSIRDMKLNSDGSIRFVSIADKLAVGTGVKHHRIGDVERLAFPICSTDEQLEIANQLDARHSEADQLDQTITTSLQQAEALRQSILKKAFSGQLVPQDPHDELASKLLARIKAERVKSPQPPFAKGGRSRSGGGISAKPRKKAVGDKLSPTAIIPLTSMDKES